MSPSTPAAPVTAPPLRVSIHGGHSGSFCAHAQDTLEAIVAAYIEFGFAWVGFTEHMPPTTDHFRYPDEVEAGLTVAALHQRFAAYFNLIRRLQRQHQDQITLLAGFETEGYTGALTAAETLIRQYQPDYIVGSLHHVRGHPFDMGPVAYHAAVQACGDHEALYCDYFDRQLVMIERLQPGVVGHFDLIRIYDPDYVQRLQKHGIAKRIRRNLECVRDLDLVLDYNLRALSKGASEPYVSTPIAETAIKMGIRLLPGDDSHGVADVGANVDQGLQRLAAMGMNLDWIKNFRPASPA